MTDERQTKHARVEAEFLRQLRSSQLRRFVDRLPAYEVLEDTPPQFSQLLAQLDRVTRE